MPAEGAPRSRRKAVWALAGAGGVVLLAAWVFLYFRGLRAMNAGMEGAEGPAAVDTEARVNVLALCNAVQSYRDEHGGYVVAGPSPKPVPQGGRAVPFPPEEAFQRLGFDPGKEVHFQYQVTVQEDPVGEPEVTCWARGDANGNGLNVVYKVRLDANGMTTPIEVEREGE